MSRLKRRRWRNRLEALKRAIPTAIHTLANSRLTAIGRHLGQRSGRRVAHVCRILWRRLWVKTACIGLMAIMVSLWVLDRCYPVGPRVQAVMDSANQANSQRQPNNLQDLAQDFAQVVTDRYGRMLRAFPDQQGVWRYPTSHAQVDQRYQQALLSYEDQWFYYHPGVNPLALMRAAWQNWRCDCVVSGGSTITMQVARILYPHPRTLAGKARQMARALQLEWHLSKSQILDLYLNYAPMGGVIEGVEAAAQTYLDKSAAELSLAESALLAVLPQAPSRLRPDRHPQRAKAARDKVIKRLSGNGIITAQEAELALMEPVLALKPGVPQHAPLLARRLVQQQPQQAVIQTSLDLDVQMEVADLLKRYVQPLPDHHSGAVLVLENSTNQVAAYAGTADFGNAARWGHVDMVTAVRSPGSTMKPFIYGLALDRGIIHGASLLSDVPRLREDYQPGNFSNGFFGPVTPRQALHQSLNLPAVQVLEQLGSQVFHTAIRNAGANYRIPGDGKANLSLALGGGGVRLEDLVMLYHGLMNQGQTQPIQYLLPSQQRLKHQHQTQTSAQTPASHWLLSPEAAWVTAELIHNPLPSRTRSIDVAVNRPFGWKTGTSYGFRDAWAIGVSEKYTIGVWLGRPDGTPSPGYFGGVTALPLLEQVFRMVDRQPGWPAAPADVEQATVCWPLGRRQSETDQASCHQTRQGWIVRGQVPPTLPDAHRPYTQNPMIVSLNADGKLIQPGCGGPRASSVKLALWPLMLEPWVNRKHRYQNQIPALADDCKSQVAIEQPLQIIGAEPDSHLLAVNAQRSPEMTLGSQGGLGARHWFLNGQFVASTGAEQTLNIQLQRPGKQQLMLVDDQGNSDWVSFWWD